MIALFQFFNFQKIFFIILSLCFCLSGCSSTNKKLQLQIKKPAVSGKYEIKLLTKDGIEYKQVISGKPGKYGGKFVLSLQGSGPKSFNYWASSDSSSLGISGTMFVGLVERNPWNGKIEPSLAKDFETKEEGREIIVHLRKGIKWSDGKAITAKDVLFTWNVILKDGLERLGAKESLLIDGEFPVVKALDEYTVSFKTKRVFAPLLSELGYPIAPAHYFEPILEEATKGLLGEAKNNKKREVFSSLWGTNLDPRSLIASGPFIITNYVKGERIELKANPNYFVLDSNGNKFPYFDGITYQIIPSGDLELFKFISGEFSYISLNPDTLDLLKLIPTKNSFSVYHEGPSETSIFLAFNMSRNGTVSQKVSSWFNNKKFREAISLGIDRQVMIDNIYQGIGSPLCFSTSVNSIYFDKSYLNECKATAQLDKSRLLLKEAGFKLNDKNELIDPKGNLVTFSIYTNAVGATDTSSPRELMAVLIKEQLKKLGIKVEIKVIEFNNLVVRIMQTGDWEACIMGFGGGDLFEPNSSANFLYSNSRLHIFDQRKPGEAKDIRDWEAEIDSSLEKGTGYLEFDQRKKFYYRIQKILWEEKPIVYLAIPDVLVAVQDKKIGNFAPSKLSGLTYNIEQWYWK